MVAKWMTGCFDASAAEKPWRWGGGGGGGGGGEGVIGCAFLEN